MLLEGDFVRLRRPPAPAPAPTSAAHPEEHLFHVSATSGVRFSVSKKHTPGVASSSGAPDQGPGSVDKIMSLGELTSHSQAFRRQFVDWARLRRRGCLPPKHALGSTPGGTVAVSADVLQRAERGGASFVLFADGRARGSFSDRTIVTLPGTSIRSAGGVQEAWIGRRRCEDASLRAINPNVMEGKGPGEGYQCVTRDTGSIECILPDGTVIRPRSGSRAQAYYCQSDTAARTRDYEDHLTPYILAVRRFATWARAGAEQRRAAAKESRGAHLAAAVEAQKNRRFLVQRRLYAGSTEDVEDDVTLDSGSSMTWRKALRESKGNLDVSAARRNSSPGDSKRYSCSWENRAPYGVDFVTYSNARGSPRGVVGNKERNEIVERMLRANRDAVLRPHDGRCTRSLR